MPRKSKWQDAASTGFRRGAILAAPLLSALWLSGGAAVAQEESFKRVTTIQVPGNPLVSFDISFIDPLLGLYVLGDRSNAAVDFFDTASNTFIDRVGGFVGARKDATGTVNNDISGPDGVAVVNHREVWAGDGDSTVKVVDIKTRKVTDTIKTNGKFRADEMAWDPRDRILMVTNPADDPPFVTFISTDTGHKVLGQLQFPDATAGLEQPVWSPRTGLFYISVPQIGTDKSNGGIAVIDPVARSVKQTFTVANCTPAGLTIGPDNQALLGCSATGSTGFPAQTVVMDLNNGNILANISQVGGSDQVTYNPGDNHYYLAARNNPGGGVLGVVDASTNAWDVNVPTSTTAHSVAADPVSNFVYVPIGPSPSDQQCQNGCIAVFASSGNDSDDQTSVQNQQSSTGSSQSSGSSQPNNGMPKS
jgi:hypothetical protein